jgi:hypothetical protein
MRSLKVVCILSLLIFPFFATVLAMAEKPAIVLPDGTLNAEQIEGQFTGKTAVAKVADKERVEIYYFAENGSVIEARNGFQKSGKWSVRDDGRLCIDLKGEKRDCRMIIKEGGNFNQYAAKLDGNHRYEKSYADFRDGDQLRKLSPLPLLPLGTLKAIEVVKLFSGQTVESVTASKSRVSHTYYDPDGTVEQVRNGVKRYGKWRVTKNARMCLQMEDLEEKCRIIVKEAGEYKKYIVKKSGHHQHSVSYRKFSSGKQF